ncbi:MAG: 6-hydroxymethylpterin diphosphokinase MptE-like protein [Dissulfurimicrobium hydrothermale]|uniref:6-hydroxymethylpterin diphosphokinase MptE-like protein n=1 Tax=Dissulfurimicrobium hydrothermale TaxID=1750598 RepID=UPI003C749FB4
MNKTFELNLKALEQVFPKLYNLVKLHNYMPPGELVQGKTGVLTLKYDLPSGTLLAYGMDDPMRDAAVHLQTVPPASTGVAVFIGMGLGYGPLIVLRERPHLAKIVIIEPSIDIFMTALMASDLTDLIFSKKVDMKVGVIDLKSMEIELSRDVAVSDTHILRHTPSFCWKKGLYGQTDADVYTMLNKINTMGSTTIYFGELFFKNRLSNITMLPHLHNADVLKDLFKGRPALLVAAGPSLDLCLEDIRRARDRCVLITADAALNTLLGAGIVPDFVTSVDMQAINFEKLSDHICRPWPFALAVPPKACPMILKRFQAKYRFLTFEEDLPQLWLTRLLGVRYFMPPMLSVAHLSLGLAIHMGADPMIFVGQDLAYTSPGGSDHARGTVFQGTGLPKGREILYIDAVDGSKVPTDRAFLSMKTQFEEIIRGHKGLFINATARGADIKGTTSMPLSEVVNLYMTEPFDAGALLDEAVQREKMWRPARFVDQVQKTVSIIKEILKKIDRGSRIAARVLRGIDELRRFGVDAGSIEDLPSDLSAEVKRFDAITKEIDACKGLHDQVSELTYGVLKDNDVRIAKNTALRNDEGYLLWLRAEIERIEWVESVRREAFIKYSAVLNGLIHRLAGEERLKKAFGVRPSETMFTELAELYKDSGDFILLKGLAETYISSYPESAYANAFMGLALAGLLDMDGANEYWDRAVSIDQRLAGEISRMKKDAAEPWISLLQKEDRVSDGSYFRWGEVFPGLLAKWLFRIKGALKGERRAVGEMISRAWPDYALRIERSINNGEVQKAEALLEAWSLFEDEGLAGFYYLCARLSYLKNDLKNAAVRLERDISYCEGSADRLSFAARVCLEAGRFDEGIGFLKKAVVFDGNAAILWEELGDLLMSLNNYEDAISAFEQYLLVFKDSADGFKKLGDCYMALGRLEAAKAAYEAAVQKMKKDPALSPA